jgi:AcrR family transcriptional regulator
VADVCREAHVGPATFYRHFGTKDEVVFAYRAGFDQALRSAVSAARGTDPDQQLLRVLRCFALYLDSQRDSLVLRDGIVLGHEGLMRRTLAVQREVETLLADGLAALRGLPTPDDTARAQAAVGLVVLRLGLRSWRTGRSDSIVAATEAAYATVRAALSPGGPPLPDAG